MWEGWQCRCFKDSDYIWHPRSPIPFFNLTFSCPRHSQITPNSASGQSWTKISNRGGNETWRTVMSQTRTLNLCLVNHNHSRFSHIMLSNRKITAVSPGSTTPPSPNLTSSSRLDFSSLKICWRYVLYFRYRLEFGSNEIKSSSVWFSKHKTLMLTLDYTKYFIQIFKIQIKDGGQKPR